MKNFLNVLRFQNTWKLWSLLQCQYLEGRKTQPKEKRKKSVKLIRLVKVCFKMPQFCTVFYKESLFLQPLQLLYILRNSPPAHSLPVLCQLLAIIDSFDELHGCRELHPPVRLLSRQTVGIETADVLHSGQQARGVCLGWHKIEILTVCLQSSTSIKHP